jgi:hypothetical protein
MILHPTVVIGVGSTGKYVVASAQKYLYEVLNGEQLKLFKFIVLETAINQQDQSLGGGLHTKPVDIKVADIGTAYNTLKKGLGDEFNWCRVDMQIVGPGAGNKRAGGRLMLFHHFETIRTVIQSALDEVSAAAIDDRTTKNINRLLGERGGRGQEHPLPNQPVPVILVVGTLAGGTCSGTCVDLGYLLRRIAPGAYREAVFFMPDQSAIGTYKANSWAALLDLMHFTKCPTDYEAVWLNNALSREAYRESDQPGPVPPYRHVYLVTQRDRTGNAHLPYADNAGSPLLMMEGLCVAANLLGLHELRQSRLVDLNARVGMDPVANTFLTHGMRGVSYPKYEISEAAACKIIADQICYYWLSKEACYVRGRREELQQEEISKIGRGLWNAKSPSIWGGLRGTVDLADEARRIKSNQITDVTTHLMAEFTENRDGTIFRSVDQNVESRKRNLQSAILGAFIEVLQEKQNLQYGEWFLDGVRSEIARARKYWQGLGIPSGENDMPAWQTKVRDLTNRLVSRYTAFSANIVNQRLEVIEDELEQILSRLEMFLMFRTFGDIAHWMETQLQARLDSMRHLLTDVKTFAGARADAIAKSLEDKSGPLLKVSRSADRGFGEEISILAKSDYSIQGKEFINQSQDEIRGMLALGGQASSRGKEQLFEELIGRIQPSLIQKLQQGGAIDIVREIEGQKVKPQTIQRVHATQALSLSTRHGFMTGEENVPSLLLTKSVQSSNGLDQLLLQADQSFPVLRKDELPLFDHMALFYQEGGKFDLDSLLYGEELKNAYMDALKEDEAVLDPLRLLKKRRQTTQKAGVGNSPE